MGRDLFGNPIQEKRDRLEVQLSKYDRDTFSERLERLKYIEGIAPKGYSMMGGFEAIAILHEAELAFVSGAYIAAVMLAQAFIERRLQDYLEAKGQTKQARRGLKAILQHFRRHHLLNELLLDKIDHLRQTRNPFTHLKPIDHPYTMAQRIISERKEPIVILETEAKDAMALMYTIFTVKLW